MNQKHVPSLELCQEFDTLCKEKGIVVPKTEYYWIVNNETLSSHLVFKSKHGWYIRDDGGEYRTDRYPKGVISIISAPLVSEQGVFMKDKGMGVTAHSSHSGWWATGGEWIVSNQKYLKTIEDKDSWPNCLQKMLNYLIETGSITEL